MQIEQPLFFCNDANIIYGDVLNDLRKKNSKDTYNRMISRQKAKLRQIEDRRDMFETQNRARIEPQLKYAIDLINNIDTFFQKAPAEHKIRMLSSIFPNKIEFDGKFFRTSFFVTYLAFGRCVILLPTRIIFRGSNGRSRFEQTEGRRLQS